MIKIIRNKKYNTDSATLVAKWSEWGTSDPEYVSEELYVKRTGEFFLYCKGGDFSIYSNYENKSTELFEKIIPVSAKRAAEFTEEHGTAEDYEKYFGEVSEGENEVLNLSIPAKAKAKLKKLALERKLTMSAYITEMIDNV